jgi:ABC-type polar amino acid transport system ATPase subunit
VLLDEPTASLDPRAKRELSELLVSLAGQGIAVLAVTHELEFLSSTGWPVLELAAGVVAPRERPA